MNKIFLRKSSKGKSVEMNFENFGRFGARYFYNRIIYIWALKPEKSENVEKFKDNLISIIERRDLRISLVGYQEVLVEFSLLE